MKVSCRTCKYFVQRHRGENGGLTGICKLSRNDMQKFITEGTRRKANRYNCSNWEDDGGLDIPDGWRKS